jgi:hypothetical protein
MHDRQAGAEGIVRQQDALEVGKGEVHDARRVDWEQRRACRLPCNRAAQV